MGRWNLNLELDAADERPIYLQLSRKISQAIRDGRLKPGARLPGARTLAKQLQLNRNTVTAAFAELRAEGWLLSAQGSGTTVSADLPPVATGSGAKPRPGRCGYPLVSRAPVQHDPRIEPGQLKWDFGVPDVRLAPKHELARALRRAIVDRTNSTLEYRRYGTGPVSRLQVALAEMLSASRGLRVEPVQLLVTYGSQMALYLVARTLIRPGDVVCLEDPGFYSARTTFREVGARVLPIPVDAQGIKVDHLEQLVESGTSIRAVFVTPHHQFPTTVALAPGRRIELLRFARRHRVAIIEDDYDHEFHYHGRPLLPLASFDADGVVLYLGSLSKLVAPGIRLGYLVAPASVVDEVRSYAQFIDAEGHQALQAAIAEMIEDGELQRHLNRTRRIYQARRDVLVKALHAQLGDALQFEVPSGGLALWAKARHKTGLDVERWAKRALHGGLVVRTGRIFSSDNRPLPFFRLGFARLDEQALVDVVRRLASALP